MRKRHLFVTFTRGQTLFRINLGEEGDFTGGDPASTYNYGHALEDHYENLANYIKKFQPATIEIRNNLTVS